MGQEVQAMPLAQLCTECLRDGSGVANPTSFLKIGHFQPPMHPRPITCPHTIKLLPASG